MPHQYPQPKDQFIDEMLAIEARAAKDAGAIGYMARGLVQATMPHRKIEGTEFVRRNGAFTLSLLSPSHIGLPYGSIPRLLVSWVTTEAVRTQERELILGDSLGLFMQKLDIVPKGGKFGTTIRLKAQMERLFSSSIICTFNKDFHSKYEHLHIADKTDIWWKQQTPEQGALWESRLKLGEGFFADAMEHSVPIDMRVLKTLKKSPMALDIYCWLTYRMSYLERPTKIPWELLQQQFGAEYKHKWDFKIGFIRALAKVLCIYQIKVTEHQDGLLLKPSKTHIPHKSERCE